MQKWSKGKQKDKANNMVLFDQVRRLCSVATVSSCSGGLLHHYRSPAGYLSHRQMHKATFPVFTYFSCLQATYDKLKSEVPKYKMITTSILSDRLKVCRMLQQAERAAYVSLVEDLYLLYQLWKHVKNAVQINGSLARAAIKELLEDGSIRPIAHHSAQGIYTRATAA